MIMLIESVKQANVQRIMMAQNVASPTQNVKT
jgi:hypothetical protein